MIQKTVRCDVCGDVIEKNYVVTVIDTPQHLFNNGYKKISIKFILTPCDHVCEACAGKVIEMAYKEMSIG